MLLLSQTHGTNGANLVEFVLKLGLTELNCDVVEKLRLFLMICWIRRKYSEERSSGLSKNLSERTNGEPKTAL